MIKIYDSENVCVFQSAADKLLFSSEIIVSGSHGFVGL